jgi:(p)ppGpp synthase/HD superfamily hydrolase
MDSFSERYDAALVLAANAHANQRRKGGKVPYIIHPVHVSVILIRYQFSEEAAIAGLLHDIVEDQGYPLADIERQFGPAVAEIVAALTERKREAGQPRPWEDRKREALDQTRTATQDAVAVKAADALHSVQSIASALRQQGATVWSSFSRGPGPELWYYQSVAQLVGERLAGHPLADELDRAVKDLALAIAETEASSGIPGRGRRIVVK